MLCPLIYCISSFYGNPFCYLTDVLMIRIDKEIMVEAAIETVFDYACNVANWPEVWPGNLRMDNVQPLPNGGFSAKYEVKMAGVTLKGKGEFTEFIQNRWFVINTRGFSHSTITCTFRSINKDTNFEKTRVTLTIEYEIPVPLLGNIAEYVVKKMNDEETDFVMSNLQTRLSRNRQSD